MDRRLVTAAVGLVGSLLASVAVWYLFDVLLLFLLVPFVPFLLGRGNADDPPEVRSCPVCEFRTTDREYDYCPRDGHRLE